MFLNATLFSDIINIACTLFMVIMFTILATATRMKNGAGWAALILVAAIVPASLANLSRDIAPECYVWFNYPRVFISLLWFPALWFFTKSQLDKSFRFTEKQLWHIIPAFVSLAITVAYYAPLTVEQIEAERVALVAGTENLPALVNDIFGTTQFLLYFTAIFFFVRKKKKYLQDNYADSGLSNIRWVINFLIVHFVFFLFAMIVFAIDPRTDSWVCPIATMLGMSYLVYVVSCHSPAVHIARLTNNNGNSPKLCTMTTEQMKEICDRVVLYLQTSCAYKNCDLTLSNLSHETNIPHGNISTAINKYMEKNFFEIVNAMRIEKAKQLLLELNKNRTVESIAFECGFRTRSNFFATFKKIEGKTPAQWLKMMKLNENKS
jgi:AraC-like DNA-binding protein